MEKLAAFSALFGGCWAWFCGVELSPEREVDPRKSWLVAAHMFLPFTLRSTTLYPAKLTEMRISPLLSLQTHGIARSVVRLQREEMSMIKERTRRSSSNSTGVYMGIASSDVDLAVQMLTNLL
jgi:hypothetical protein